MMVCRSMTTALIIAAAAVASAAPIESKGRIEGVTVYRGQALVTRLVTLEAGAGSQELLVTDLPSQVQGDSLYAVGSDGVEIRAVRFRTRAVLEQPRAEIREIDTEVEQVAQQIRQVQSDLQVLNQKSQVLDNLEKYSLGKASTELDKGTLNVDSLVKLTEYLFKQRSELADTRLKLNEKLAELQEQQSLLQRRRGELTRDASRTVREAVVFLSKQAGAGTVRLSYIVNGATWQPTYTARAEGPGEPIELEYSAMIQQMTGEDWDGVQLHLSTASPTMVATAPVLTPLWVTLRSSAAQEGQQGQQGAAYVQRQQGNRESLSKAIQARNAQSDYWKNSAIDNDWNVNATAGQIQILDLQANEDDIRAARMAAVSDDVLSVTYRLKGPISLPSRNDQQMIQITQLRLPGQFYYLATPVLTSYVYQQAELTNTSDTALLAGPVTAYQNGQFAGTSQMPMVAKGQRFTLGFGVDSQLRVKRDLASRDETTQGGNRKITFNYQFNVTNYKDRAVTVRILDRLPDPRNADIKVTLEKTGEPISQDELYQKTLRKAGILMWEIQVPANASGAKMKSFEYSFSMEFARSMQIAEPSAGQIQQERMEFEQKLQMYNLSN